MPLPHQFLLVDDNENEHALAQAAFNELCPECHLTCVHSGQEALELLRTNVFRPDVVLLDINMPSMSGFEVLGAMKQDPQLTRIPVVILSTSSAEGDVSKAYTLHASSYLVKSTDFEGFLEQIDKFLTYWQANRVPAP